jgi:hypothetical protein
LERYPGVVAGYLFGSVARGQAHRESDVAGELSTRQGMRFEDYTEAVKNLGHDHRFTPEIVDALALLPGFPTWSFMTTSFWTSIEWSTRCSISTPCDSS